MDTKPVLCERLVYIAGCHAMTLQVTYVGLAGILQTFQAPL